MKTRLLLLLSLSALVLFGPIAMARAQWSKGYHKTLNGNGRVKREGSKDFDVQRVRMDLESGKTFTMTVYGGRETIALTGRWGSGDRDKPSVQIERCDGRRADIDGNLEFSTKDGRLERVKVSGTSEGKDFSLDFRSTGNGNGGPYRDGLPEYDPNWDRRDRDRDSDRGRDNDRNNSINQLNGRLSGNGALNIGSDRWQVKSVRVDLQRNGNMKLTLSMDGRRDEVLEGRYTGTGDNISLRFDRGLSGRLDSASGLLRRKRNGDVQSITASGYSGRTNINLTFSAL